MDQSPYFAASDPGDEFSNNLFSDLAPILALFGEQVAMQFMAESLSWADSIIFSMAPIGVLTAVVGAIRVGGGSWLKALIGRAKENIAVAESELMSSTSGEVCEVFNGRHIVRLIGKPSIKELISMGGNEHSFQTLSEAINDEQLKREAFSELRMQQISSRLGRCLSRVYTPPDGPDPRDVERGANTDSQRSRFHRFRTKLKSYAPGRSVQGTWFHQFWSKLKSYAPGRSVQGTNSEDINRLSEEPPNISLNIHPRSRRVDILFVAAIGIIFQVGVLVFDNFITYHPNFKQKKGGRDVMSYAFPLTCIGTLVLVSGVFVCSSVIESATTAEIHTLDTKKAGVEDFQMLWIQQGGSVSDQLFESYLIMARDKSNHVITSRRRGGEGGSEVTLLTSITTIGAVVAIIGFILQFVGLRAMTWYASISQLIATLVMVVLRACVRRGLSKSPWAVKVPKDHEIDWLATRTSNMKDCDRLLGREEKAGGQEAAGQAAAGQGWENRGHRSWALARIHKKNGSQNLPWHDKRDDGFWKMGSFRWKVQSVEDLVFNRYQELRKFKPTAHSESESASMKTIKARIHLGQKTGWTGPAFEQAVRVASAIETFMNAFFPIAKNPDVKKLVWSISNAPASKAKADDATASNATADNATADNAPASDNITFNLSAEDSGWKADVAQIEAFLSLWLFSVSEKEAASIKKQESTKGSLSGTASKNHSLRLLTLHDPSIPQCMYWWLGSAALLVKKVAIKDSNTSPTEMDALEIELSTPTTEGTYSDKADDNGNDSGSGSPSTTVQSIKFEKHRVVGYRNKPQGNTGPVLGVLSDAPLVVLYAQELFSAFIWSFVHYDSVRGIEGPAELMPVVKKMDECGEVFFKSITLEHKELNRVVKAISRSGLGSVEDIMWSIIPPLMMTNKLPDMSAVIHSIRARGRVQESYHRWQEAGKLYLRGFRAFKCKYMVIYQRTIEQATCALTEFMRELTLEINITEKFRDQKYHRSKEKKFERTQDLINLRETIFKELKEHGMNDVVIMINDINIWQQRDEGSEDWKTWLSTLPNRETGTISYLGVPEFWTKLHHLAAVGSNSPEDDVKAIKHHLDQKSGGVSDPKDFSGLTPLHYANSKAVAKILLGGGAPITAQGHDGSTPLHNAARAGQRDLVALLIEHGSELNSRDKHRRTPLHWAAHGNYVKVIELLLGKGADPLVASEHGRSPLHMAASRGNLKAAKMLVDVGKVDINITDSDGRTALHLAVAGNHARVISYLSELGKGWPEDQSGYTAIHLAAFLGDNFENVFKAFLGGDQKTEQKREGGTDQETEQEIEKRDEPKSEQETGQEAEQRTKEEAEEKPLRKAEEIFNLPTSAKGETVLHVAARYNKASVIKFILSHNPAPFVDKLDKRDRTPLMCAAMHGSHDAVTHLLRKKSNVDAKDNLGRSALHLATTSEVIQTLYNGNANTDLKDTKSFTPLLFAVSTGNDAAVKALTPISDVDAVDNEGRTALHLAVTSERNSTIIKTLLNGKANSSLKNKEGFMPLLYAASIGNDAAVKALIPMSDVNAVNEEGKTALHLAIAFHLIHVASTGASPADAAPSINLIKRLLKAGAKTDVKDNEGKLPLEYPVVEALDWLRIYLIGLRDVKTIQMEDARAIARPSHPYRDTWDDSTDDDTEEDEEEDKEAGKVSRWR